MRYTFMSLAFLCACASPPPPAAAPASAPAYDEDSPCAEVPATSPSCIENVSDIDEAAARAALGDRDLAIVRDGDRLTIFTHAALPETSMHGSLQGPMTRIEETDLFIVRYRLADLDRATLAFIPPAWIADGRNFKWEDMPRWRGPQAPPTLGKVEQLRGERFERTLWSEHLQETRRIFIYLPPGHDRSQTYPAVFAADGDGVMMQALMIERMIDDGLIPRIILVGAGSGAEAIVEDRSSLGIADFRAADYLPGFTGGGDRFEQHLRFFSEELVAYAVREFGVTSDPQRRAVTGFSNGGSFAVFAALRRPDVFGVSIPLSKRIPPPYAWLLTGSGAQPRYNETCATSERSAALAAHPRGSSSRCTARRREAMPYVDGFVVPVPKKNIEAYRAMAQKSGQVWKEHGALEYHEYIADDVKPGKWTSFPQSVDLKDDETVVFSWIVYPDRAARDRINEKVMADPRLKDTMNPDKMPFDGKRMIFGGFAPLLDM